MQQKGPTADAAGLGLHQRQHRLNGDGGINRRAAGLQHLGTRFGGQGVGRGHHAGLRRIVGPGCCEDEQ